MNSVDLHDIYESQGRDVRHIIITISTSAVVVLQAVALVLVLS